MIDQTVRGAPLNGIAATMFHDEGAIAQCGACRRYTLDRKALGDRQPVCTCGKQHCWSGSFKKPGPDAQWHGPAPAAAAQAETAQAAPALVDLLMDSEEAYQIERAAGLLEDYHRFIGEHVKSDDLVLHPYPPEIEGAAEELRAIVGRIGEFKPTTDYLFGHADGLEWAARQAEANDPRTGDWLFDDPHELAKALRKGPELPEGAAQAAPVVPAGWSLAHAERGYSLRSPSGEEWLFQPSTGTGTPSHFTYEFLAAMAAAATPGATLPAEGSR